MKKNFNKIDNIILFGGGKLLSLLIDVVIKKRFKCLVITSKRHAEENIFNNCTLVEYLKNKGIDHIITDKLDNEVVINKINNSSLGLSFGAAWIFKKDFIHLFNGKLLNMHCSRLPIDRGGGGLSWRIMRGERRGISLIHVIDSGIDTGEIVCYEEYLFPMSCRIPSDYENYSINKNLIFLENFLDNIINGNDFESISQVEYLSSYFPRLNTDIHGYIDWNWKAKDIESFICAFDAPYKGASTFYNNNKIRFHDCFLIQSEGEFHPFQWGIVYRKSNDGIYIAANKGVLLICNIKNESNEVINNKVKLGDRFYTPNKYLEEAKQYKAVYTPNGLKI